jgi:nitrate/nitrite transport system substrate-binding protein
MAILMTLNNNGQAITLSKKLADKGAVDGASLAKVMRAEKGEYTFAHTFPTGTHAMWLYYWMAANGINPLKDAKVITVPPPQMVANMRVGNMDGYCVGEPWGQRAIMDGIGITAVTTQDIWKDHPEKVLGTTSDFVKKYPNTARAVTAAILEAGKWIDTGLQNKNKMAETIADKSYVNTSVDATFPYLSDGMWFLTQHKRWGLLKEHPDYLKVATEINRVDVYKQAAAASKTPVPKDLLRTSKLIDGVVWDGKNPKQYADSFKLNV